PRSRRHPGRRQGLRSREHHQPAGDHGGRRGCRNGGRRALVYARRGERSVDRDLFAAERRPGVGSVV
ncbi:hypothetical protein LTR66_015269, partial [Elasticomyces elasticus]